MRNHHSPGSRYGEYDVEFLRHCKKIEICDGEFNLVGKHPSDQDLPFFQSLLLLEPALGQLIQLVHTLFCQAANSYSSSPSAFVALKQYYYYY